MTLLACVLLAVGFAPAPLPRPERRDSNPEKLDLAQLQGTWEEVRYIVGANEQPGTTRCVVEGSRMTFYTNGKILSDWTITLDVRARPKGMYCKTRGGSLGGVSHDSVYELTGHTLKLCYGHGGTTRKRFPDLQPAPDRAIMVLVRASK